VHDGLVLSIAKGDSNRLVLCEEIVFFPRLGSIVDPIMPEITDAFMKVPELI